MSQSKFSTKAIDKIMKFVNMKGIVALKEGMLNILPLTVVGSIFLIIGSLPSEGRIGRNRFCKSREVHLL